ncbi:MAG: helix-turn-helix domain-containing protein [Tardiphaga sp.]|jgi:Ner family transcriptional regulator|nr:helix-turn-helix domain-containing protein [Tardiphaga sp.]
MASPGWHRADIVAAIHKQNTTLAQLARDNGLHEGTLRSALSYPRKPSNEIIARELGVSLHALWPYWFTSEGVLTAPTRTSGLRPRSSQKRRRKLNRAGARR